ncbi:MAG: hypothetical protein HXK58_09650, partial [Campylobacter concisus]|nr:hypothetical protein [Campylobacter concisus]
DKFAKGKDDEKFLGHFNSGSIILNLAHIKNVDQFVSTLGHELKHAIDYKAGKFIPGDSKQDRYAKLKEDSFSDYLSKALNLQDSGINAKDAAINYTKNQSSLNTLLLNSYMFNGLDKSKGDNRQFSQPEIDWLKANGNNFANFIRERTGIDISQDEAISRLSVQALKQSDNVWFLMFNKDDTLAKEFLTKSDNKDGLFVVDKFDNRNNRLNLDVAINNIDFYNKYIHPNIDSLPLETVKNSILNLASNADKIPSNLQNWYKDQTFTASSLRDGAISLAKDITVNGVSGVRNMYYNIFNNDKKILEKVYDYNGISDDIALISGFDTSSLTGVAAIGKEAGVGLGKGAVYVANSLKAPFVEMEKRVAAKVVANTPKGGTLGSDGILRHNGKEYVARNFDLTGNKVIYEQVINKKGTGNFKTTNDKGYFITDRKPKLASPEAPEKDIKFYDISKTPGIVAGTTIGGGIDLGSQYINNGNSFKNLDYTEIIVNALGGAYGGAASGLFSAIGRGAFVNSSTELYSQLKDRSKDVDAERVVGKGFAGGFYGLFGSI